MTTRPYRKVDHGRIDEVGDEDDISDKKYVEISVRDTENIFEDETIDDVGTINAQYVLPEDVEEPDSLTSMVSIPLNNENVTVKLRPSPDLEGWEVGKTSPQVLFDIITEMYPDFPDQYVIGRDMEARGYHVREDGTAVMVNSELINKPDLEDVTFFVTIANEEEGLAENMEEIDQLRKIVEEEHPYTGNGFRIFTIGVISDNGQVYGLRVQSMELPISNKFRMQRMSYSKEGKRINELWQKAAEDPKYRREALTSLEFEIGDVYLE